MTGGTGGSGGNEGAVAGAGGTQTPVDSPTEVADGKFCTLPGSRDCTRCGEDQCAGLLVAAGEGECGGTRDCIAQYCLCNDFECEDRELCRCIVSCSIPGDPNACRPGLSAYLTCLALTCADACDGFDALQAP